METSNLPISFPGKITSSAEMHRRRITVRPNLKRLRIRRGIQIPSESGRNEVRAAKPRRLALSDGWLEVVEAKRTRGSGHPSPRCRQNQNGHGCPASR